MTIEALETWAEAAPERNWRIYMTYDRTQVGVELAQEFYVVEQRISRPVTDEALHTAAQTAMGLIHTYRVSQQLESEV